EQFKQSLDYLPSARKRHDAAEWSRAIDQRIARVNGEIQTLYASLESKAAGARRRGADAECKEISERVARWKLPERAAALRKAVEAAAVLVYRQGPGGLVCVEAEHFAGRVEAGAHSWTPVQLPAGFEGDGAMAALPNDGARVTADVAANSPRLDYSIEFKKTGTHYL